MRPVKPALLDAFVASPELGVGYPCVAFTRDGGCLCATCVESERSSIDDAGKDPGTNIQWEVICIDVHWEGAPIQCDHCNAEVESAYGDPFTGED